MRRHFYEGNGDKFPEVMASARARAGNALDFVGQRLGDRPYLLGADFSAADIMMGFTLFAARVIGVLDERHAVLTRYLARLEERPAFRIAAEL
jgi:glutathione S-transferase